MSNKFVSFLKKIGHDVKVGLGYALKFEPAVEGAMSILDPPVAALMHLTTATIIATEQKFTAIGQGSGTGAQKFSEVAQIIGPTVQAILAPYGVTVDAEYLHKIIDPIVALLNALPAVGSFAAVAAPVAAAPVSGAVPLATAPDITAGSNG